MPEVSPTEILQEIAPEEIPAAQPPGDSNYRPADIAGISCASCVKFSANGVAEDDDEVPVGICNLYEATVRGDYVSDGYAENSPPLDNEGQPDWEFSDSQSFAEVHLASAEVVERKDGKVIKEIMRTGDWPVLPTAAGVDSSTPLRVIKSGVSNPETGTIALDELVANFKAGSIPRPQVPLSDEEGNDHKNLTRLNTGFVTDMWVQESTENDEDARLVAEIDFTEPDVKEKALRGTFSDVSCGIPWSVRSRGKTFGPSIEHVCITNKPFMDDLGPFLALSDEQRAADAEIIHFGALAVAPPEPIVTIDDPEVIPEPESEEPISLSYERQKRLIGHALVHQLRLSPDYEVEDIEGNKATVTHRIADATWQVPFEIEGEEITLSPIESWIGPDSESAEAVEVVETSTPDTQMSELEVAQRLRELRLGQGNSMEKKEQTMPDISREELEKLELSDGQRSFVQTLLDENAAARGEANELKLSGRIDELKKLGLEERPGALKLYRQVALSDDGGPAAVLLSDEGAKERVTALEILDRFIEAIKGSDEKVELSDQQLVNNNDPKPPVDAQEEVKPFEERLAEGKAAIGQK